MAKVLRQIDDEALEKPFDKTQFLRLLAYLKPYRGRIAIALVLTSSSPAAARDAIILRFILVTPFLNSLSRGKESITYSEHLLRSFFESLLSKQEMTLVSSADWMDLRRIAVTEPV